MSNRTPLVCGVLADEHSDLAGDPDDHEQSGIALMGMEPVHPA